jgi:uroporphyrinogen decarboxylase
MKHYGIKPTKLGPLVKLIRFLPFRHRLMNIAFSNRRLVAKGLMPLSRFYAKAGIDLITSVCALYPRKLVKGGFIDEFGRHMRFEYYERDGTEIIGYVDGFFKDFDDYSSWELPDPNWGARYANFKAGRDVQQKLDNQIFSIPSMTGMMECTWEAFGLKNFARLLAKRKRAKKVFDDRGKFSLEVIKQLAELDAKMVLIYDDYGFKNGLFMSPKDYRSLVFPWLKRICAAAHKQDCKIMLHSDGDLRAILEDLIIDCKIDALNPIEPTTANPDYDIFKIHERYGDDVTLVGNVSPVLLAKGKIKDIQEYTKKLMLELGPGGGYILASGHSINPAITLDRWQSMMETRFEYGRYPISC